MFSSTLAPLTSLGGSHPRSTLSLPCPLPLLPYSLPVSLVLSLFGRTLALPILPVFPSPLDDKPSHTLILPYLLH